MRREKPAPVSMASPRNGFTHVQFKTIQEVITLGVFVGFSVWYLGEPIKWNHLAGFALMIGAAFLIFKD